MENEQLAAPLVVLARGNDRPVGISAGTSRWSTTTSFP
jgi:hypothetical protein